MKSYSCLLKLLLIFSTSVYSQNSIKETRTFFEKIQSRKIIENIFNEVKASIKSDEKELFKSQDVKYENNEDVEYFHNFLDEEIDFLINETYNQMFHKYVSKPKDTILSYLTLAKDNKELLLDKSGFRKELTSQLNEKKKYIVSDLNLTFREIRAKHNSLKLSVIENDEEVDVSKMELELYLNIKEQKEHNKISILKKSSSEITLPKKFNYDLVESLTIVYKGKEYHFNRFNSSMPKEIQDLASPLSKYCFTQLEKWTLVIDEKNIILETRATIGQSR